MTSQNFINISANVQIAFALAMITVFLAVIVLRKTSPR